jgi:hypothetical protein
MDRKSGSQGMSCVFLVKSEDPTIEILAQLTPSTPLIMLFNISKFGSIYPKKTSDVF